MDFPVHLEKIKDLRTNASCDYHIEIHEDRKYFIPHSHNFLEFSYVIQGMGRETINGKSHVMKPGTFSILLPYQVHSLYYDSNTPLKYYVVTISMELLIGKNNIFSELGELLLRNHPDLSSSIHLEGDKAIKMNEIFKQMHHHYYDQTLTGNILAKAKIIEALALSVNWRQKSSLSSTANHTKSSITHTHNSRFWDIVYYVHTHYNERLSLNYLSEVFDMSVPYISTSFKKILGVKYLDFLNEVRIQNACALLASTNISITDIAYETGFDSYSTFSRVFKKLRGVSAKEYRKLVKH
ncbi:AraC family transcriptional regulator [Petroclostridium xylanilyticum]|uniref:AraC family transcriptional regulator n=1 Tax=Petroclostridium xylanilyticum TaxID=1792311 RepID=UPI000B981CBA|nr:AraC family transcriptional regulator [Petroclostridium xylanilyticum]